MERDNRVLAEMNSLAGNLNHGKTWDEQSKQPSNDVSHADIEEPLVDEYFGGVDIVSECCAYLHTPPNSTMVTPKSPFWIKTSLTSLAARTNP